MAQSSPDHAALIERLRGWKWFTHLDASIWGDLTTRLERIRLAAGEVLFRQGDPGNAVYVVLEGCLGAYLVREEGEEVVLGEMPPGNLAGEIQMMTGGARTATVRAIRDSELLRIPTEVSDELLRRSPATRRKMVAINRWRLQRSLLAEVLPDIVGPLDDEALGYLQRMGEWLEVRRGETLFERGDVGDSCYLLLRGRLAALLSDERGHEQVVSEMSRGEFVGEMALVTGEPRSMTVRAQRDSLMIRFGRHRFDRITERYPQLLMAITRIVVGRLSQTTRPERARTAGQVKTIAVVPAGGDVPWEELATRLSAALSSTGSTLRLTRELLRRSLGIRTTRSGGEDDPAQMRLSAWLDDQELRYRFVLYVSDATLSAWTRRCIRQADLVLLVAAAGDSVDTRSIRSLLESEDGGNVLRRTRLVLLHSDAQRRPRDTGALLSDLRLDRHHHLRWDRPADVERLARLCSRRAVGLVLGGGGARGFAHIGVIKALREAGIAIDATGGTSLGALIAAQHAMGWDPQTMLEANLRAFVVGKPHRAFTLPLVSVVSDRRGAKMVAEMFPDIDIEDLWLNYFAISANLTTARQVVHQRGAVRHALKASSAIPGVFAPAVADRELLVDGGLLNNLPGDVMRRLWGGRVISVDVSPTSDLRVEDKISSLPSAWSILWSRLNPFAKRLKAPNILEILTRASTLASIQNAALAKSEADLYLEPPVDDFKMFDMADLDRLVDIGYEYAVERLEDWLLPI